ncbi:conjugal transfer protein TraD [Sphingomonas koreensis]
MRKPRDFDAELKTLNERAKQLQARKVQQLGDVVIATEADALSIEELAGLLLGALESKNAGAREAWRNRGATFFQKTPRRGSGASGDDGGDSTNAGDAASATGDNHP